MNDVQILDDGSMLYRQATGEYVLLDRVEMRTVGRAWYSWVQKQRFLEVRR